jgi:hypothetical protein
MIPAVFEDDVATWRKVQVVRQVKEGTTCLADRGGRCNLFDRSRKVQVLIDD